MKKIKKNLTFLLTIITILNSNSIYADESYKEMYVFGDSLNDANQDSKVVVGDYPPQSVYVSRKLFNQDIKGYKNAGHVFALSGNQITQAPWPFPKLSDLIENKFFINKKQVGENNLYYVAIGNNDAVMSNLLVAPFPDLDIFNWSKNIIEYRANYAQDLVKTLGNDGKNTIIVSNLLQMELTPIFATIRTFPRYDVVSYIDAIVLNNNLHWRLNDAYALLQDFVDQPLVSEFIYHLGFVTDYKLRQLANDYIQSNRPNGIEYVKNFRNGIYNNSFIGHLINPVWLAIQDHFSDVLGQYTQNYSDQLINKYFSTNENIVFLDFRNLLLEVFYNPAEFGIDNFLVPQCHSGIAGIPSSICRINSRYFHQDQNYLFADLVHPNFTTHELIGNYIVSILSAPVYFSSIIMHAKNTQNILNENILNNLTFLRLNQTNHLGWHPLLNITSSYGKIAIVNQGVDSRSYGSNQLILGGTYNLNEQQALGLLFSYNYSKAKPYQLYRFNAHQYDIRFFYQYYLTNKIWFNWSAGITRLEAKNIKRTLELSSQVRRTEEGETSLDSAHFNIAAGYDWRINAQQLLIPYLQLTTNRYHLNGYQEKSNRSSAMGFDKKKLTDNTVLFGINYIFHHSDSLSILTGLTYQRSLSKNSQKIYAGLKTAPRNFFRKVDLIENNNFGFKLGLNNKINHKINVGGDFRLNYSKDSKTKYHISLSIKRSS